MQFVFESEFCSTWKKTKVFSTYHYWINKSQFYYYWYSSILAWNDSNDSHKMYQDAYMHTGRIANFLYDLENALKTYYFRHII